MTLFSQSRGFTLMELLVSTAIIVFIVTVSLFDYRAYGENAAVDKLANEVVLALREAQVYATSVKEFQPGTDNFYGLYGVHFHSDEYIFRAYEGFGTPPIDIATYPVPSGITRWFYDSSTDTVPELTEFTILFEKSKLTPIIRKTTPETDGYRGELVLKSPNGSVERRVCVEQTGRIFISRSECP